MAEGWLDWTTIRFVTFEEVGLPVESSDTRSVKPLAYRVVWRFAQQNQMIILTANRSMKGKDSLEETIRDENTVASLPVMTLANIERMHERGYRERCAARLIETVIDIENSMGVGRIFVP